MQFDKTVTLNQFAKIIHVISKESRELMRCKFEYSRECTMFFDCTRIPEKSLEKAKRLH